MRNAIYEELFERLVPLMGEINDTLEDNDPEARAVEVMDFIISAVQEKLAYMSQEGEE